MDENLLGEVGRTKGDILDSSGTPVYLHDFLHVSQVGIELSTVVVMDLAARFQRARNREKAILRIRCSSLGSLLGALSTKNHNALTHVLQRLWSNIVSDRRSHQISIMCVCARDKWRQDQRGNGSSRQEQDRRLHETPAETINSGVKDDETFQKYAATAALRRHPVGNGRARRRDETGAAVGPRRAPHQPVPLAGHPAAHCPHPSRVQCAPRRPHRPGNGRMVRREAADRQTAAGKVEKARVWGAVLRTMHAAAIHRGSVYLQGAKERIGRESGRVPELRVQGMHMTDSDCVPWLAAATMSSMFVNIAHPDVTKTKHPNPNPQLSPQPQPRAHNVTLGKQKPR